MGEDGSRSKKKIVPVLLDYSWLTSRAPILTFKIDHFKSAKQSRSFKTQSQSDTITSTVCHAVAYAVLHAPMSKTTARLSL